MAAIRFGLILALVVGFALIILPLHRLATFMNWGWREALPQFFHRSLIRLIKINVRQSGEPAQGPALLVANHVSWIDISVIGSLAPMCFVAKSDVASWPVFGALARAQGSVFVERDKRMKVGKVNVEMAQRLSDKRRVVLFPEGTTGDGNRLLRFFTSHLAAPALAAAQNGGCVAVQPVSIAYQRRHGLAMNRIERSDIAWYGDTALLPHLWGLIAGGGIEAQVTFGEAQIATAQSARKPLAARLAEDIRCLNYRALHGRDSVTASNSASSNDSANGNGSTHANAHTMAN